MLFLGDFMQLTKSVLDYERICDADNQLAVIIVAAGSSSRMQGINKQFAEVKGIPVLARTVSKFQKCEIIKSVIIVTKSEDILKVQQLCDDYGFSKVTDIVAGGNNRTESVRCGLERLSKGEKNVLIHDGARPFVTQKMIKDVAEALKTSDCALVAEKSVDTVKQTDSEATVTATLDRERIYLAQTPQGVNVSKYKFALNSIKDKTFTDDASIMEAMGFKCVVCKGSPINIKITTKEDLMLANAFADVSED